MSNPSVPSDRATPPLKIRLQILDKSTPQSTFTDIAYLLTAVFGDTGTVWDYMFPPPRPSDESRAVLGGLQQALDARKSTVLYVIAVGSFPDGQERILGMAVWGKPGFRYEPLLEETMAQKQKEAFEGYNLAFRNEWKGTPQRQRDELMGDAPYWYQNGLAVHPAYQGRKIGSTLLDYGLAIADKENLPVLLEATEAGRPLYESRKFVKVLEYPNCIHYAGLEETRFPLYRRPAQGLACSNGV
ncbi:hypothetical protein QFC22_005605 [Naganishia vaughanmartiniae]|uniref:Uncharacterized protein n=1 Tax=Naganishia vaughanmartiniae TaxID=1424756 RepID=A0ACC2WSI6_9TREE|nr:hypothetical protein QFC22_005605 [Naganishia vaughanmartiniae]